MNKYLFLDVDGVLNSHRTGGIYTLKRRCLQRLQAIVVLTGCKIVLSSTWRKYPAAMKRLSRVLRYRGLHIHSVTPVLDTVRGTEIALWLTTNDPEARYAIVDDDSDMLDSQLRHFFQTDGQTGLSDTIAYRIIQHLSD